MASPTMAMKVTALERTPSETRALVEAPAMTETWATSAPELDGTEDAAEVVRSENNILRWMEYLPEDCIRTMIEMGWDIST